MSKFKRCFDVISSAYYFYVKTKILTDFQIAVTCIFEIVTVLEMCFFSCDTVWNMVHVDLFGEAVAFDSYP